ncbi:hypothetical protein Tco_0220027, partial [Tanacetum coccineum]
KFEIKVFLLLRILLALILLLRILLALILLLRILLALILLLRILLALILLLRILLAIDSAVKDPAGVDSAVKDPAGVDSAIKDPAGVDSAVKDPAGVDSAVKDSAGVDSVDGVSTGSPSAESNHAVSSSVSAEFHPVYADESTLPPGQHLGSSENTTRFPVPSDVCMDQISSGIFTSSSYAVEVNPVPTKRVNTIHPQSQILGDLASPVMTRSRTQKSKFGESAFIGYIHDQQRTNHPDQL